MNEHNALAREDLNDILQHADDRELRALVTMIRTGAEVRTLQHPTSQTLLLPVQDPISGNSFYGGEILATAAVVEVAGKNGWAMVMDDNAELALDIATVDGAWAAGLYHGEITALVLETAAERVRGQQENGSRAAATRVKFDQMPGR